MPDKWIEIARTGTFTDSAGRPQTFTEDDLEAIAHAYDPAKRDAPLVFGHPKTDAAPAFGWAARLRAENGKLFAQFALRRWNFMMAGTPSRWILPQHAAKETV